MKRKAWIARVAVFCLSFALIAGVGLTGATPEALTT